MMEIAANSCMTDLRLIPVLIPAYKPGEALVRLVRDLIGAGASAIVVVDDGSGEEYAPYFDAVSAFPEVHLLRHAINLGKGAALKTGLNHVLIHFPQCLGVVTADADGQHHPDDILRIAQRLRTTKNRALIIGAREFSGDVPLRSRIGNQITRFFMLWVVGQRLSDSQTGLRGIPRNLIPHLLLLPASGYEFELDMLLACKHQACPIAEEPIRTIYLDGNRSSHFRPMLDSMRIYFLLFRFGILAILTALLDNSVFILVFSVTGRIAASQIFARAAATVLNYAGARQPVFHSRQRHAEVLPKYLALVICSGALSYAAIQFLHFRLGMSVVPAKLLSESVLFLANFIIQRDLIFTRRHPPSEATDWDRYYTKVPATAHLTRKYTSSVLLDAIRRYVTMEDRVPISIVEIGGANSCFLDRILQEIRPASYDVVDTNRYGLSLLERRLAPELPVRLRNESVFAMATAAPQPDLVFSVGLIEHFDVPNTRRAVLAHLDSVRPGGTVVLTFPTPTWLYRLARGLLQAFHLWQFPDERPLQPDEVLAAIGENGQVLYQKTLWPLILTQHLIVARKR
jgi:glycosyltransferase involved in cell wall biosynthesis